MNKQEFLNNYAFISYESINPDENYGMLGYVQLLAYNDIVICFKHVKKKDGHGDFFAPISFNVVRGGQKGFVDSCSIDSTTKRTWLLDFVRDNVHQMLNSKPLQPMAMSSSLGLAPTSPQPQGGAATDEQCPF